MYFDLTTDEAVQALNDEATRAIHEIFPPMNEVYESYFITTLILFHLFF